MRGNAFFSGERKDIITDKSVHELAGYAIMQQEFWNQFTLNAGVRYEHNSTYGSEWVPQAGFTWRPFGEILLKLLFRKGFVVLICENFILHSDLEIKRMRI